jgi:FtsH-binding integral membrane protein
MDADVIKTDFSILFGLTFVVIGFLNTKLFYSRGLYGISNKRAPTWAGRLMFIGVGGLVVLFGLAHLFLGYGTVR